MASSALKRKSTKRMFSSGESALTHSPIPDLDIPTLPAPVLTLNTDGTASTARPTSASRKGNALELDSRAYERPLSKREKAAVSYWSMGAGTQLAPQKSSVADESYSSRRRPPFLSSGLQSRLLARMTCLR